MKTNDQYAQFKSPSELRMVRTLPGPIERVWEFLTDSEKRGRWLGAGFMEQRKGGKYSITFKHSQLAPDETPPEAQKEVHEKGDMVEGTITRWEPPRVLAYMFGWGGESEVTFELTPEGKDVVLVLTHRLRGDDIESANGFAAGWHTHFAHLIAQLEGAPRPPFWPMWTKLKEEYTKLRPKT